MATTIKTMKTVKMVKRMMSKIRSTVINMPKIRMRIKIMTMSMVITMMRSMTLSLLKTNQKRLQRLLSHQRRPLTERMRRRLGIGQPNLRHSQNQIRLRNRRMLTPNLARGIPSLLKL